MLEQARVVIFDIDGTLADISHRLHFVEHDSFREDTHNSDWDSFLDPENVKKDLPIWQLVNLAKSLNSCNYEIWLLTGRQESLRVTTEAWLESHGILYTKLIMRKNSDYRPDYEVKAEMLDDLELCNIQFAVDDRTPVVEMMKNRGILCLQV